MSSPYTFHSIQAGDKSNPPILFLHGFLGSVQDWGDVITSLSDMYWCIAVDLPGHGKTVVNGSKDAYRMENCANGLMHFLDDLGIYKCNIVAYSMGGRLALYMVINFSHRFERVVLESASPGLKTHPERQDRRMRDNSLAEQLETISLEQFLKEWYDQPMFTSIRQNKERFSKLLANRINSNDGRSTHLATSLRMMGAGIQPSLWDDLHKIQARLLLIAGEGDAIFKRIAVEMGPKCLDAAICAVHGAGHNVHWEKPEEYARRVNGFLSSYENSRSGFESAFSG